MTPDEPTPELTPEQVRLAIAGEWCPPTVPDDQIGRAGYIWIPNWGKFQHYRNRRPAWIKTYVELLDNDDWLALPDGTRGVLAGIWLLVARAGQGRCNARATHVQSQLVLASGHSQRSLVRLNHAGFLRVIASKLPAATLDRARAETETETEGGPKDPPSVQRSTPRPRSRSRSAHAARHELGDQPNGDEPELTRRLRRAIHENRESVVLGIAAGHYDRQTLSFLDDDAWHKLEAEATLEEDQPL